MDGEIGFFPAFDQDEVIERMNEITENSPEEFKEIMTLGSELIALAKQGNVAEF